MKTVLALGVVAGTLVSTIQGFLVPPPVFHQHKAVATRSTTTTVMMVDDPLRNMMRSARKPGPNDRVVELKKPLGLTLEEDEKGNVYVKDVKPGSQAARSGIVKKGDLVSMVSATFGDEVWSARGAGLNRVMSSIQIRQGDTVTLVLEGSNESTDKKTRASTSAANKAKAEADARAKKDALLKELQADDEQLKKKKLFGLF